MEARGFVHSGFFCHGLSAFSTPHYLRIVRASAWYDLLVTWPFALPWTFAWVYAQLGVLAHGLHLPGALHPLDSTHLLLANLLGSVVVVWSIARIAAPSLLLGRLDGVARFLSRCLADVCRGAWCQRGGAGFHPVQLLFGVLQWWRGAAARAPSVRWRRQASERQQPAQQARTSASPPHTGHQPCAAAPRRPRRLPTASRPRP